MKVERDEARAELKATTQQKVTGHIEPATHWLPRIRSGRRKDRSLGLHG